MNGIEKEVENFADVVRVNMMSKFGREIGSRYKVTNVPSTVVVDGSGEVTYQHAGIPNKKTIVSEVMATESTTS